MLIKDYELNDKLVVEIGKFAILWNLFEKNYCNCFCKEQIIYSISGRIYISDESQRRFAKVLNRRRKCFGQDYDDYTNYSLYSENKRAKSEDLNSIEAFLKQDDGDTTAGCLISILRIRNNMMHGLKDVSQLDNQLELFKAANEVLESLEWR